MLIERIKVFFAKHKAIKWLIIMMILAGIIIVAWLLYQNCLEQSLKNVKISDTSKGIIGTLIGAVVGGSLSFIGTVYVSRKTQKAQSAVKRNNVIYKPLYNELNEIHQVILKENPYPPFIEYKKQAQTILRHPQYTVWDRIKMDSRFFEVPKKLKKAIEELYGTLSIYEKNRGLAAKELGCKYRDKLKVIMGDGEGGYINSGDVLLPYVMTGRRPDDRMLICNKQVDADTADMIWSSLVDEAEKNDILIALREARIKWDKKEQYVLDLLSTYIKLINAKYEGA